MKQILRFLVLFCVLSLSRAALATHFHGESLSWRVADPVGAPLTVEFVVISSWSNSPSTAYTLDFGDGQSTAIPVGTAIGSTVEATTSATINFEQFKVTHTYALAGVYTAKTQHCCRGPLVNGNASTHLGTSKVSLGMGEMGGPVAAGPGEIQMRVAGVRTYDIATYDPDGDVVTCRFATAAESGLPAAQAIPTVPGGGAQPTLTSGANKCTITWDLNGALIGQGYALPIIFESVHGGVTSSSPIEILVETTNTVGPVCTGGGLFAATAGQALSVSTTGTQGSVSAMTVSVVGDAPGHTLSPGGSGVSPFANSLSWTPATTDAGTLRFLLVNYRSATNITAVCPVAVQVAAIACVGGQPCSAGVGQCQNFGVTVCMGGTPVCNAVAGTPMPEVCDGHDTDCNGVIDNGNPGGGGACVAACGAGVLTCTGGSLQCIGAAITEVCNGVDDNCDSVVDEGFNVGAACTSGLGACAASGTIACNGVGGAACSATAGTPTTELCDGVDNDCDGVVDDGNPNGGGACSTNLLGICGTGVVNCTGGLLVCTATTQPGQLAELCDGLDNDCDGSVDEGLGLGGACTAGVGACAANGTVVCSAGAAVCNGVAGTPTAEMCGDAIDSDCDGDPDNGCFDDTDGDGLLDLDEPALGLDPLDADSDDDGVLDGDEPSYDEDFDGDQLINALDPDSDEDGLFDGTEMGTDCAHPDTDMSAGKCVPDADLGATVTNPLDADTDDGTVGDGSEDANHNGAVDVGETDPNDPTDDVAAPACTSDADCGDAQSARVCDPNGKCIDGCRGSGGNGCPSGLVCTSTDTVIGQCISTAGCTMDSECGGPDSGLVCSSTGSCVAGCRGSGGNGCPAGFVCSSSGQNLGSCNPPGECESDADCGNATSGMLCNAATLTCVEGCRGTNGNGCPDGQVCSSIDLSKGVCEAPAPGGYGAEGGGVCAASPGRSSSPNEWLFAVAVGASLALRRRRGKRAALSK